MSNRPKEQKLENDNLIKYKIVQSGFAAAAAAILILKQPFCCTDL